MHKDRSRLRRRLLQRHSRQGQRLEQRHAERSQTRAPQRGRFFKRHTGGDFQCKVGLGRDISGKGAGFGPDRVRAVDGPTDPVSEMKLVSRCRRRRREEVGRWGPPTDGDDDTGKITTVDGPGTGKTFVHLVITWIDRDGFHVDQDLVWSEGEQRNIVFDTEAVVIALDHCRTGNR